MANCPVCKKYFAKRDPCADHIRKYHQDVLEDRGVDPYQLMYLSNHDSLHGVCMCGCNRPTEWNYKTGKPYKVSTDPECKKRLKAQYDANLMNARGINQHTLMSDMVHQQDMIKHRKISGVYTFKDGGKVDYTAKLELSFYRFCDQIMDLPSSSFVPFPEPIKYYDHVAKVDRFYIPDSYMPDYDLIVEIKDGGEVKNTNPKFLAETRYKVTLKEEAIKKLGKYNYIRISGTNYGPFVETLFRIVHDDLADRKTRTSPLIVVTESTIQDQIDGKDELTNTPDALAPVKDQRFIMFLGFDKGNLTYIALTRTPSSEPFVTTDLETNTISLQDRFSENIDADYCEVYRYLGPDEKIAAAYSVMIANAQNDVPDDVNILDILWKSGIGFTSKTLSNNDVQQMDFTCTDSCH